MNAYLRLMRLDKPIGIYLLLWPTLWALFLANDGWPSVKLLLIFVLGVVLMRSAGCVINDYADRHIDKHIERTAERPITNGEIAPKNALKLCLGLMILAFLLVLMTNQATIQLAIVAAALAAIYPFTKRWIQVPQLVLGLAFAMSVPMAFAASLGFVPNNAWWVFLATVVWTMAYDTLYAMADRDEDLKIGIKSSAILFAQYDRWAIGLLQVLLIAIFIKIAHLFALGMHFNVAITLSAVLMIYHQYLIKDRQQERCFQAFLHNNFIGLTIFVGLLLDYL